MGIDTTNRTRQTMAKKEGWPWLEERVSEGLEYLEPGLTGTKADEDRPFIER